jgi:hypothetical protein
MKRLTVATVLMLAITGPVWAQAPAAGDPHHPPAATPAPAQPARPPALQAQPNASAGQGGMMMNCPMMHGDQAAQRGNDELPDDAGPGSIGRLRYDAGSHRQVDEQRHDPFRVEAHHRAPSRLTSPTLGARAGALMATPLPMA